MKTYKGLKVPETREKQMYDLQIDCCKRGFPDCKTIANCKECLFDSRNLPTFIEYEKEKDMDKGSIG